MSCVISWRVFGGCANGWFDGLKHWRDAARTLPSARTKRTGRTTPCRRDAGVPSGDKTFSGDGFRRRALPQAGGPRPFFEGCQLPFQRYPRGVLFDCSYIVFI